jgi:predicted transcriptional regulator of viral defense system
MRAWTFITNHGLVLAYIAKHQKCTAREIASAIEVTEWTVHKIIDDLEEGGYIKRKRNGRVNIYRIDTSLHLRHDTIRDVLIGDLLRLLGWKSRIKTNDETALPLSTSSPESKNSVSLRT